MKTKKIGLFLLINLLILMTGCGNNDSKATTVETVPPIDNFVEAFGIIKAEKLKNITLDFSAVVNNIHVVDGQKVSLNDTLVTLDLSNYKKLLQDKEYEHKIAQLDLQKIQSEDNPSNQKESKRINSELIGKKTALSNNSDPDIQNLMNELSLAKNTYKDTKNDYTKQEILYHQGAISESDFEEIKRNLDYAKNNIESLNLSIESLKNNKQKEINELEKSLNLMNTNINNSNIEIEIQNQKILSLETEITSLKEKINKNFIKKDKIVSDIKNSVVYEIEYEVGDTIDQSKKVLSLLDLDTIIVEANVSEEFIKDVKIGAEVDIIVLADSTKEYKGKVSKISNMAIKENGETVVPIEISVNNKDSFLRPNFNVDVKIYK